MTTPVLPKSVPNCESFNRIGEQTLQARPPKRQRQDPELRAESDAEQVRLGQSLDNEWNPTNADYFCQRCRKFDLGTMLTKAKIARSIGTLSSFKDPDCQLCDTIRHFVKHHWGFQCPAATEGRYPQVFMQSKKWGSFSESESSRRNVYRIILALNRRPPNLKLMRRALNPDLVSKFVLTELEIDPTAVGNTNNLISLRRPIPPSVDFQMVNRWLKACDDHVPCTKNRTAKGSSIVSLFESGFRLIDVEEGRLVEKRDPCDYVALSYVWGELEPAPLRLYKESLYALSQPSSLNPTEGTQSPGNEIPGTIADTITLCRSIGRRYLWVDSLCIVQDDPDEKKRLIHGMDRVYENAILTVIALSGNNAAAGLAGIRPRSSSRENHGRQNLFHRAHGTRSIGIGRISLKEQIQYSHWSTRGWTYQEQLLSPRKLYFSCDEVFYECLCATRREGYSDDQSKNVSLRAGAPRFGRSIRTDPVSKAHNVSVPPSRQLRESRSYLHGQKFQNIVSTYSRKTLKEQGDILNALTGIYHKYYHNTGIQDPGMNALQAIPVRCSLKSLLWFTSSRHCERRSIVNGFKPSSWSWISWVAPIDFIGAGGPSDLANAKWDERDCRSLIDKWSVSFQEGNDIKTFSFSFSDTSRRYEEPKHDYSWYEVQPRKFLGLFPKDKCEGAAPLGSLMPGVLDFEGPYSPKPKAELCFWIKRREGKWELHLRTHGMGFHTVAMVSFDPGEDAMDGFVFLLFNYVYLGLCVKKAGDYFKRVGVVEMRTSPAHWETVAKEGLLDWHWKRILLV